MNELSKRSRSRKVVEERRAMGKPLHLHKSIQDCLSKIKQSTPHLHFPSSKALSSSTTRILRGCKHPKTLSFALARNLEEPHNNGDDAATLEDIDRFLFENFKSLYINDDDDDASGGDHNSSRKMKKKMEYSEEENATGFSRTSETTSEDMGWNSTTTATATAQCDGTTGEELGPDDFIAVFTYSPRPYDDFRRSMEEMIEARMQHRGKVDWEFMEELLFSYMNLNGRKSYKYLLSAFVDLVVDLRENWGRVPAMSRSPADKRK